MRGPYGRRGLPVEILTGLYAAYGYQVVLQSTRGSFGSGGDFDPGHHEVDDGADTVAWLRAQPWFDGRFATVGSSYMGFTQWALLVDPPPELTTAAIVMGPHDFGEIMWGTGAFALRDALGWNFQVAHQESGGTFRRAARTVTTSWRLRDELRKLPRRRHRRRRARRRRALAPFVDRARRPFGRLLASSAGSVRRWRRPASRSCW